MLSIHIWGWVFLGLSEEALTKFCGAMLHKQCPKIAELYEVPPVWGMADPTRKVGGGLLLVRPADGNLHHLPDVYQLNPMVLTQGFIYLDFFWLCWLCAWYQNVLLSLLLLLNTFQPS